MTVLVTRPRVLAEMVLDRLGVRIPNFMDPMIEGTSHPVSRVLWPLRAGDHPSVNAITGILQLSAAQPTRTLRRAALEHVRDLVVFLALLRVGFAVPSPSPMTRWALTPPFHPHRPESRQFVFCGTVPRVTPGGRYPPPCSVEPGLSSTAQDCRDHPDGSSAVDSTVIAASSPHGQRRNSQRDSSVRTRIRSHSSQRTTSSSAAAT